MARLAQMKIREVSLVDKAANLRKFLIIKNADGKTTPEEVKKTFEGAAVALDNLMALVKGKGDGNHAEIPNYAQQAKDLLMGVFEEAVSFFTDEERTAVAKAIAKKEADPASKKDDATVTPDKEIEFTPEEKDKLAKVTEALGHLKDDVKELVAQ